MKRNLLALSLVLPTMAQAFGLGEITVHSKLGEPLKAEIEVTDPAADQDKLKLALADKESFYRVGLEVTPYISGLQFRLVEQDNGSQVIEVTSQAPAREPFLSFLLEANWASGRMLKEYTLLLDPPVFDTASRTAKTSEAPSRQEAVSEPAQPMQESQTEPRPVEPAELGEAPVADRQPASEPASEVYSATPSEYEVQAGDTLWEVARDVRPNTGVDINTMMMALLEANPQAFINNNINGLKRGAVLRVPSQEEINNMGLQNALQLVREQNSLWQEYRGQMASEPVEVSEATSYEDNVTSTGESGSSEAELRLVPPAGEDENQASPNAAGTAAGEDVAQLEDELNRTREELASKEQETEELASRVSELESLVDKLERAVNIKDADLAALQAELEAARQAMQDAKSAADAMPAGTETEAVTAEEMPAGAQENTLDEVPAEPEQAISEEVITEEDQPQADEFSLADDMGAEEQAMPKDQSAETADDLVATDAGMESDTSDVTEDATGKNGEEPAAQSETEQAQSEPPATGMTLGEEAPAEEGGLFGISWTILGAAGGGVLLLLVLLLLKKRSGKQEEEADEPEASPEPPALEETQPVEAEKGEELATEELAEEESDRTETETVEPVIALDDEEEPDLSALELEEDDEDVDLSDIYEGSDVQHPELESESAADESVELEGLYEGEDTEQPPPGPEQDENDDFDFELEEDLGEASKPEQEAESSEDALEFDLSDVDEAAEQEGEEFALDFELEEEKVAETDAAEVATDDTEEDALEFDFDLESDEASQDRDETAPVDEFDLDTEETAETGESPEPVAEELDMELEDSMQEDESLFDEGDAEEELDIPTDDLFEDEDAVATKLDLARAYLDMGDPDGARTMLEEVVQEGNDEQKAQAQELLDGMS